MSSYLFDTDKWASSMEPVFRARMQLAINHYLGIRPTAKIPLLLQNKLLMGRPTNYITAELVTEDPQDRRRNWHCSACNTKGVASIETVTGMAFGLGICAEGDCFNGMTLTETPRCFADILFWQVRHLILHFGGHLSKKLQEGVVFSTLLKELLPDVNVPAGKIWVHSGTDSTLTLVDLTVSRSRWKALFNYGRNCVLWSPSGDYEVQELMELSGKPLHFVVRTMFKRGLTPKTVEELCSG